MRARKAVPEVQKKPGRGRAGRKNAARRPAATLAHHPCFSFNDSGVLSIIGNKVLREKIYERVATGLPVRLHIANPGVEVPAGSESMIDDGGGGGNTEVSPDTMCPCDVDTNCP